MQQSYDNLKWIFEPDGSLLDIYIKEVDIDDWSKVIDFLNSDFELNYQNENQIDKRLIQAHLKGEFENLESITTTIFLGAINLNCHFFAENEIEFDIEPSEVNCDNYLDVLDFMTSICRLLQKEVILTGENNSSFPLIKVDATNGVAVSLPR